MAKSFSDATVLNLLLVLLMTGSFLSAQTLSKPINEGPPPYVRVQQRRQTSRSSQIHTLALPADLPTGPVCANAPAVGDLHPFGYFKQVSRKDAAGLNLQFGTGGGSGSWDDQSQVILWRQGKTFTCPSTDGKYTVVYGSEWDSGLAISQDSLSGKASFATIAANVEINNSATSYDYVAAGYTSTSTWEAANGKILSDLSTNSLNVSNYATFDTDFGATLTAAAAMVPEDPPKVIGYAPIGITDLAADLAKGYALMYIAQGRGCQEAVSAFPVKDKWVETTIRQVYLQMSSGKSDCNGKADPAEIPLARQLLSGIEIVSP